MRHHEIGEKEVDLFSAVFTEQALSVVAVGRFDYLVAESPQHSHGDMPNTDVVFENENGFSSAARFLTTWFFVGRRRRRRYAWKINLNNSAFTRFALNAQVPAALMDNAVTSCEAKAASLLVAFGGEKWLEEMGFGLFAHSSARVGDLD